MPIIGFLVLLLFVSGSEIFTISLTRGGAAMSCALGKRSALISLSERAGVELLSHSAPSPTGGNPRQPAAFPFFRTGPPETVADSGGD
jgi:hypothetical protein